MSVYEQWSASTRNRDAEGMIACLHDDYTFVRHQTGTTMNKAEMAEMLRAFMGNDGITVHSQRCLYENEDVMVEHSVIDFPDGSREAIISFHRLKNGRVIHVETGATLVTS